MLNIESAFSRYNGDCMIFAYKCLDLINGLLSVIIFITTFKNENAGGVQLFGVICLALASCYGVKTMTGCAREDGFPSYEAKTTWFPTAIWLGP